MVTSTIFFDGQFGVGLATRVSDHGPAVTRHVFGPDPGDAELTQWFPNDYCKLKFASTCVETNTRVGGNPKRRLREARRALEAPRTCTRAQGAWSTALEAT